MILLLHFRVLFLTSVGPALLDGSCCDGLSLQHVRFMYQWWYMFWELFYFPLRRNMEQHIINKHNQMQQRVLTLVGGYPLHWVSLHRFRDGQVMERQLQKDWCSDIHSMFKLPAMQLHLRGGGLFRTKYSHNSHKDTW